MYSKNAERQKAEQLLLQGIKPKDVSEQLGVHLSSVYNWKKELNLSPKTSTSSKKDTSKQNFSSTQHVENEFQVAQLKKENTALKNRINELEAVVTDLILKLKSKDTGWLD
ncbi:helix-turn-helix domain-containing protein [Priestia koreensis]|uniref:Uncharacterized protein n=1 Tax=Priestia koreensis TaxID=284581 RepID=A0A0M0KWR6_9BACI|nr:helix-turn-helix domain-containing protein [Priestia koreensis]KOO42833.1 hypothetical protein AMD01_16965 [Priestia koreensis]MCM3005415.1 helix-turn-helix domain-containing protein [Priestia koreensis]UNL86625.1 helix-turn-helix domain-containing protein [Priestia koreensis]